MPVITKVFGYQNLLYRSFFRSFYYVIGITKVDCVFAQLGIGMKTWRRCRGRPRVKGGLERTRGMGRSSPGKIIPNILRRLPAPKITRVIEERCCRWRIYDNWKQVWEYDIIFYIQGPESNQKKSRNSVVLPWYNNQSRWYIHLHSDERYPIT